MRKSLRPIVFAATFVGGFLLTAYSFSPLQNTPLQFKLTIPQASLDLSDLDLRDSLNRPIHSVAKKEQMKALFVTSLNQMLLNGLTPQKRALLIWFSNSWKISWGVFRKAGNHTKFLYDVWFNSRKDRSAKYKKITISSIWTQWTEKVRRRDSSDGNPFTYLTTYLLSSTILLR